MDTTHVFAVLRPPRAIRDPLPSTAELIARAQLAMQESRRLRDDAHAIKAAIRRTREICRPMRGEKPQ